MNTNTGGADTVNKFAIDQGAVIYGIRSAKYPDIPCYGVIITARCDIAQKKVPKYYYLVALDASDWFCAEHGYNLVYDGYIKSLKHEIDNRANELDLSGSALISFEDREREVVLATKLAEKPNKKHKTKVDDLQKKLEEYQIFASSKMNRSLRSVAISKKPQLACAELKKIYTGAQGHYYFVPQHAYLGNEVFCKGLIVDLLEIGELSLQDANRIETPGIDYQILPKVPTPEEMFEVVKSGVQSKIDTMLSDVREITRLTTAYWLNDDSDFVAFEGTIKSPWCEHLMQRFSNAFIRIGIKDPTEDDFQTIINNCFAEVTEQ